MATAFVRASRMCGWAPVLAQNEVFYTSEMVSVVVQKRGGKFLITHGKGQWY